MSIWQKIKKTGSSFAKTATNIVEDTNTSLSIGKLKLNIANNKNKKVESLNNLGLICYDLHRKGELNSVPQLSALCQQLEILEREIERDERKVSELTKNYK